MKQLLTRVVYACVCLVASSGTLSAQPTSQLVERVNLAEFMEKAPTQDNTSVRAALAMGSRVRMRSTAVQRRLKGIVVAVDESAVTLATDDGLRATIPLTSITFLEKSLERKRSWLKGAAIGAVAGIVDGLAFAKVVPDDCPEDSLNYCSRAEAVSISSLAYAIVGAGAGALVKSDRWETVTLNVAPPQVREGGRPPSATTLAQPQDNTSISGVPAIGSRVRIRSTAMQARLNGLVVASDKGVVTLSTDGGLPISIPLASITVLETSVGRKRNWLKGAAVGSVVGLVSGLTTEVNPNYCSGSVFASSICSRSKTITALSGFFAIVGAGIGALIKTDDWTAVTLSVAPVAQPGQPAGGLGVAVRF